MKFRRKTTIVEAIQWYYGLQHPGVENKPPYPSLDPKDHYYVTTIHGQRVYLTHGDWILPEQDGVHYYPCNPKVFAETYEPVEEEEPKRVTISGKPPAPGLEESGAPQPLDEKTGMFKDYWVLSKEERAKGFVRPVRRTYIHVGPKPPGSLRDLTPEEAVRYEKSNYFKFEPYPESELPRTGRFWTREELNRVGGCRQRTNMALPLAETYASNPKFYGATFCATCKKHYPVAEFRWEDGSIVGS